MQFPTTVVAILALLTERDPQLGAVVSLWPENQVLESERTVEQVIAERKWHARAEMVERFVAALIQSGSRPNQTAVITVEWARSHANEVMAQLDYESHLYGEAWTELASKVEDRMAQTAAKLRMAEMFSLGGKLSQSQKETAPEDVEKNTPPQ